MARSIITLTTDFGAGSSYVAQMKGVILSIDPSIRLVDVTHDIPPQDIRQAAIVLEDVARWFPRGTIHICVVDPGVGTARRIALVDGGSQIFVAADNGVLSRVVAGADPLRAVAVSDPKYWLQPVSDTFHGRDIMAPVAAHVARGTPWASFGPPIERLESLAWPLPRLANRRLEGTVISVDSFGNLVTNIDRALVLGLGDPSVMRVHCGGRVIHGIVRTYAQSPAGTLVALFGSAERLEVALVQGHAGRQLGVGVDAAVIVEG